MKRALALLFAGAVLALAFVVAHTVEANRARTVRTAAEFAASLAPHTAGGAAAAAATVATLFADDFRAEEARFAAALPRVERGTGRDGGTPGTNVQNRRS